MSKSDSTDFARVKEKSKIQGIVTEGHKSRFFSDNSLILKQNKIKNKTKQKTKQNKTKQKKP